jgi:uncharacterized protein DUF1844
VAQDSAIEGFKVTDRRRRADDDQARVEAPTARSAEQPHEPRSAELGSAKTLAGLFIMLATSALVALGESPDPLTGRVQKDLAQASEAIDILVLLREKTERNRTPEESDLLEQIIYDLQLRFVRATGVPPSG